MSAHFGKICPFCKTEFRAGDDIVVCSDCEMPHHKDCWVENQGCTTFACIGTISAANQGPKSADFIICKNCDTKNDSSLLFCQVCGHSLIPEKEAPPPPPVSSAAEPPKPHRETYETEMQRLIGANVVKYIYKFKEMELRNKKTSWNFNAFWAAPFWFLYRKMYPYGIGLLAIDILLALIDVALFPVAILFGHIAAGLWANGIYMRSLESKVQRASGMSEPYKAHFISKNGGVSKLAVILGVIAFTLVIALIG
ncbi:MAG: RING finger protein [Clostridia bacterium]|nr:RING finger protein [Clostridia bacterium]